METVSGWCGIQTESASPKPTYEAYPPDGRINLSEMPTISVFYGILIRMFYNDHPPPHFHARYSEFEATSNIATLEVIEGQLPRRALNLVSRMGDDT